MRRWGYRWFAPERTGAEANRLLAQFERFDSGDGSPDRSLAAALQQLVEHDMAPG